MKTGGPIDPADHTVAFATMTSPDVGDYVDGYLAEDDVLLSARARAAGLGCSPIAPAGGAALGFLAATVGARAVVEIGTGAGVSGLWLLRGMAGDGVLTSIDIDPEKLRVARVAFTEAGFGPACGRACPGGARGRTPSAHGL